LNSGQQLKTLRRLRHGYSAATRPAVTVPSAR
jgi:hypothetical protein